MRGLRFVVVFSSTSRLRPRSVPAKLMSAISRAAWIRAEHCLLSVRGVYAQYEAVMYRLGFALPNSTRGAFITRSAGQDKNGRWVLIKPSKRFRNGLRGLADQNSLQHFTDNQHKIIWNLLVTVRMKLCIFQYFCIPSAILAPKRSANTRNQVMTFSFPHFYASKYLTLFTNISLIEIHWHL